MAGLFGYRGLGLYERLASLTTPTQSSSPAEPSSSTHQAEITPSWEGCEYTWPTASPADAPENESAKLAISASKDTASKEVVGDLGARKEVVGDLGTHEAEGSVKLAEEAQEAVEKAALEKVLGSDSAGKVDQQRMDAVDDVDERLQVAEVRAGDTTEVVAPAANTDNRNRDEMHGDPENSASNGGETGVSKSDAAAATEAGKLASTRCSGSAEVWPAFKFTLPPKRDFTEMDDSFNLRREEDEEEAATKASSADEAKSSAESEDGRGLADFLEDSADEGMQTTEQSHIEEVNCKIQRDVVALANEGVDAIFYCDVSCKELEHGNQQQQAEFIDVFDYTPASVISTEGSAAEVDRTVREALAVLDTLESPQKAHNTEGTVCAALAVLDNLESPLKCNMKEVNTEGAVCAALAVLDDLESPQKCNMEEAVGEALAVLDALESPPKRKVEGAVLEAMAVLDALQADDGDGRELQSLSFDESLSKNECCGEALVDPADMPEVEKRWLLLIWRAIKKSQSSDTNDDADDTDDDALAVQCRRFSNPPFSTESTPAKSFCDDALVGQRHRYSNPSFSPQFSPAKSFCSDRGALDTSTCLSPTAFPTASCIAAGVDLDQQKSNSKTNLGCGGAQTTTELSFGVHGKQSNNGQDASIGEHLCNANRVQWVSAQRLVWPAAAAAAKGTRFFLCIGGAGQVEHELELGTELLTGITHLRVPDSVSATLSCSCRQHLSVLMREPNGDEVRGGGIEIGGLLDDIFRYDGSLGCQNASSSAGDGFSFSIWAPTAEKVELVVYDEHDSPTCCEQLPMRRGGSVINVEEDDGVWRAWGPSAWSAKYYTYCVRVHDPVTDLVETMEVPDPHLMLSVGDGQRSQICRQAAKVRSCTQLAVSKPPFLHRAQASVYELNDLETGSGNMLHSLLSCDGSSSDVDLQLRRLAQAGLTHVYVRGGEDPQRMVPPISAKGLRVVVDAPYSCSTARSVLARIVPGYCLAGGKVELRMVERLVCDSLVHWTVQQSVDGLLFQSGQLTPQCMRRCRAAFNAIGLEEHGVDGPRVLLFCEEALRHDTFEAVNRFRMLAPGQPVLSCCGISCLNSRACDALGIVLEQCWRQSVESQICEAELSAASNVLQHCLAGSLRDCSSHASGAASTASRLVKPGRLATAPDEVVNSAVMLSDAMLPSCSPEERVRIATLGVAAALLGQGVPLLRARAELFQLGVPHSCKAMHERMLEHVCELLCVRASTPLLNLTDARDVLDKVTFSGCSTAIPGVMVMETCNGPPARFSFAPPICERFARVIVVLSMQRATTRLPWSPATSTGPQLHPVHMASTDKHIRSACFDGATNELVIPALSAVVFVEALTKQSTECRRSHNGLAIAESAQESQ